MSLQLNIDYPETLPDAVGQTREQFEQEAKWLQKKETYLNISPFLLNSLDLGEAAVIQLAKDENIQTVCIDEAVGRRIARLNGLSLTGSIGILLRAKSSGYPLQMQQAIARMHSSRH